MVILYGVGWIPISYNTWIDEYDNKWVLTSDPELPFPVMDVIKAIISSFHSIKAEQARSHFHGGSLHDTVDWNMTLSKKNP